MDLKKRTIMIMSLFIIVMILCTPKTYTFANSKQTLLVEDGVYLVDVLFQVSQEQETDFFDRKATVVVQEGISTLVLKMIEEKSAIPFAIYQKDKPIEFQLNEETQSIAIVLSTLTESLEIQGAFQQEGQSQLFTEKVLIDPASLPKQEVVPPEEEEEEESVTPPPIEKPEEGKPEEKPQPPVTDEERVIPFVLFADGTTEPSMMNTYVEPKVKVKKKNGHYLVQMKITESSWVTGLQVEQNGKMVNPTVISEHNNERIIQFTMLDITKPLTMWVKVAIPEINYYHEYFVQFVLDREVVADWLKKPVEEIEQIKPVIPSDKQTEQSKVTSNEAVLPVLREPSITRPERQVIPKLFTKEDVEEALRFDRNRDGNFDETMEVPNFDDKKPTKNKKTRVESGFELSTSDKIKIIVLLVIALLSGFLFVKHLKKARVETDKEAD